MTENKRYSFNWERGHPNFWDNHCDLADCYLTCEDVVNRLNDLHDENKELKEINQDNQDHISSLEEEKINLQIKLQKIRDYAMEDGEVKQGVIEKVIMND